MSFLGYRDNNGRVNVTAVDGTANTSVYATDGSLNVTTAGSSYRGLYNACGALHITVADGSKWVGNYASDGSLNVFLGGDGTPYGCLGVNDVNGTLSGGGGGPPTGALLWSATEINWGGTDLIWN